MRMFDTGRLAAVFVVILFPGIAAADPLFPAVDFSVDPASPSIGSDLTPDDVLISGPNVLFSGTALDLKDDFAGGHFDNLADYSYGRDGITKPLSFSVDRLAVGLLGSDVYQRATTVGAAGDVYRSLPSLGTNELAIDRQSLGLIPGFFGDDLDGLSLRPGPHFYFTIDPFSATNGFGAGTLANDIFIDGVQNAFADGEIRIGLDIRDAIDGLILLDRVNPGTLDPGQDLALFSLSSFSPSTFTFTGNAYVPGLQGALSPADVLFTDFSGRFSLWSSAAALGLRPEDNVDSLAATVPEPATWVLCAVGTLGLLACRRTSISAERSPRI